MSEKDLLDKYSEERECDYKDEHYKVRDNGSVFRLPKNGKVRQLDSQWTFGKKNEKKGYMTIGGHIVHIIVATAFYGSHDSKKYVVDHIDTNRCNNRSDNLRWVTKLENILLNETTRKKIEYLCGSVWAFLENPSLLKGHEADDPNFGWMRTVTKEESENTLKRWKSLQERPRKPSLGNPMGEWMFTKPQEHINDGFKMDYQDDSVQNSQDSFHVTRMIGKEKRKKEIKEHNDDVKKWGKEIIPIIKSFSETKGWFFQSDVKNDRWKADILMSDGKNTIAFKLLRRTNKIAEEDGVMKEDGVTCYWLIGKPEFSFNREGTLNPVFLFTKEDSGFKVTISDMYKCSLEDFISAAMNRKLNVDKEIIVKSIKVRFVQEECWKCGAKHFIYIVSRLICDEGEIQNTYNYFTDERVDEFDSNVHKSVCAYLNEHPELNYDFGEIKERNSNMVGSSYLSFGCPKCDAIFGGHYLSKEITNEMLRSDDEDMNIIKLEEPGIKIKYMHWIIAK